MSRAAAAQMAAASRASVEVVAEVWGGLAPSSAAGDRRRGGGRSWRGASSSWFARRSNTARAAAVLRSSPAVGRREGRDAGVRYGACAGGGLAGGGTRARGPSLLAVRWLRRSASSSAAAAASACLCSHAAIALPVRGGVPWTLARVFSARPDEAIRAEMRSISAATLRSTAARR